MAVDNPSSLDGVPLLSAQFDEKIQEVRQSRIGRTVECFCRHLPSLSVLRPSFLNRNIVTKPPHPTVWLDGLRGIAAFLVFVYHFQHQFHRAYNIGYGGKGGDNDHWVIQLPIIRLLVIGGPMVSIFWVLSGIALSLKPIQFARSHAWDKFFDTMYSAVFRRWLRLYLPCLVVQTCVIMANLIGLFDYAFELHEDWPFAGTKEKQQKKMETKWGQLGDWTKEMWKFMNPFTPIRPGYDSHLWTIQYEFRNSIVLFAALVGVAKLKPRIRLGLVSALYLYCVVVEQGDIALFLAGIVLAEFLLIRDDSKKTLPSAEAAKPEKEGKQSLQAKAAWTVVLIIGLHLLSYPAWNYKTSWGYVTITQLTPSFIGNVELSWQRVGAAVLLLALCGSDYLRKPFSTPLAVYLGKISFPLYIIHGPIVHILGYRLVPLFWNIVGNATLFQYELGLVLAFLVQMVVVVWLADLVMRTVDTPSVRLGRTLQTWWSV